MKTFSYDGKEYEVDAQGFLVNPRDWDEDFAEGMASKCGIPGGLTDEHWTVIRFVRTMFDTVKSCPLVYVACKRNDIGLGDLERLFPTGYLRGTCKLAGVTYREGYLAHHWLEDNIVHYNREYDRKSYTTDSHGFLLDASDWDENFAIHKAYELKMPEYLTDEHWKVIRYLRQCFEKDGKVPTIYETCEATGNDLETLEQLFPDGYHRGAGIIAGLRVR